jgi:serine/threonine protein kinase
MKMASCTAVCKSLTSLQSVVNSRKDVKPGNVLVNLREGGIRFSDVQLGDLGSCCHKDSKWATTGAFCGTPVYASPEQIMEMPWNTASDVWSFGAVVSII